MRDEHFDAHGIELGALDELDYEAKADAFLSRPLGNTTLECIRPLDGARIRYDFTTQEFGIVSSAGFLLTYFIPNPREHGRVTNRAYFEAECRKQ